MALTPKQKRNILRNAKAAEMAHELFNQIIPTWLDVDELLCNPKHFWALVAREAASLCGKRLEDGSALKMMDDDEAKRFEKREVPYGIHKGKCVADVDTSYWVEITEGEFEKDLVRYMRSDRYRAAHGLNF